MISRPTIARKSVSTLQAHTLVAVQQGIGSMTMEELVLVSQGIIYTSLSPIDGVFYALEINECSENLHICEQVCVNTNGSYSCECNPGYSLSVNGFNCLSKRDSII